MKFTFKKAVVRYIDNWKVCNITIYDKKELENFLKVLEANKIPYTSEEEIKPV